MRVCFRSWKPRVRISGGVWYFSVSVQETVTLCGQVDSFSSFKVPHLIAGVLGLGGLPGRDPDGQKARLLVSRGPNHKFFFSLTYSPRCSETIQREGVRKSIAIQR